MNDAAVMPTRHKLDVHDYERMVLVGILGQQDRVELIHGEIMDMSPIGQSHEGAVNALNLALVLACQSKAIVSVQNSVRLDRWSVPQPDFAVFRYRTDFYLEGRRPTPADALLLVEVADSSLRYDQEVKLPLYAAAGIPEYWIVDMQRRVVDAYRRPEGGGYAEQATHRGGDQVPLSAAPDIVVTLPVVLR
jgi:Uma2 family endonuclease